MINSIFKLFSAVLFLFSMTVLAQNPITRIQSTSGTSGAGNATSFAVTMPSTPVNGNALVAIIATNNTTAGTITSIGQSGATWTRATQATNTNGITTEIWYAPNVSGAGTTITINQVSCRSAAVVIEYANIALASPLDQTANATGNSVTASTGTTTATYGANALCIGGIGLESSAYTLGAVTNSFTTVANSASINGSPTNNAKVYALEKLVSVTGTATCGGTISTDSQWSGAIATFKEKSNSVTVASSSPTLCINTVLTNIIHTTIGATGIGTGTGLPSGVTASWASNTITIKGTPSASGTFTYSIPLTGGVGSVNAIGTITVSPASVGGSVAGSATVCTGTNSTTLTLSGYTGAITRWESSLDNFATAGTSISNTITTLIATNLTASTYYRAVVASGACTATNSSTATVTVSPPTPATPGTITGTATQCPALTAQTYSITAVTNATTYNWIIPTGWSITAGAGTNSITVTTGAAGQSGNISVTAQNSCGTSASRTLAVTVSANNTVGVASSTPTVCINTALTSITHTTSGATGIANAGTIGANGLPAGVAASLNSNTITIFGTPSVSGTFNYSIPLIGGCGAVNATGTITVSPASVGGTISGNTSACSGTNSTVLTLSGLTGTITKWQSATDSSFIGNLTNISNTTTTLTATNLTSTTYYRAMVSSGSCSSSNSATATIAVDLASVGGSISGDATVCSGTNSTLLTLSSRTGTITKWQSATDSNFSTNLTDIANTTTSLTATNLTTTKYYRAVVELNLR